MLRQVGESRSLALLSPPGRAVPAAKQQETWGNLRIFCAGAEGACFRSGFAVQPRSGHRRAGRGSGAASPARSRRGPFCGGGGVEGWGWGEGGGTAGAVHTRCAPPRRASVEPARQRSGSPSCSFLLWRQLADFNKENIAVCFPCAFKLETCLVPTVVLRAGRSKYGRARRRWGSVLPEERRIGSLFAPMPPGRSAPGGWGALCLRSVGPGARAGGGVRCPRRPRPRQDGD